MAGALTRQTRGEPQAPDERGDDRHQHRQRKNRQIGAPGERQQCGAERDPPAPERERRFDVAAADAAVEIVQEINERGNDVHECEEHDRDRVSRCRRPERHGDGHHDDGDPCGPEPDLDPSGEDGGCVLGPARHGTRDMERNPEIGRERQQPADYRRKRKDPERILRQAPRRDDRNGEDGGLPGHIRQRAVDDEQRTTHAANIPRGAEGLGRVSGALIGLDARMASPVPSGLGTYAIELTRALTRLDAANSFVIIRQRDAPPLATASNVREAVIDGDIDAPVNLMRGPAIRRLGLDVYHSLHHFLPIGLRGPRVVLTLHDLIWIEHRRLIRSGGIAPISRVATQAFARAAMRFALNRADRVVAISAHTASRATARFALDPSRVDVIPHGVDHAMFSPAAVDVAPEGGPYFLCLGNSKPYKNIQMALRAFALCAGAARPGGAGDEVRLTITGRGDSLENCNGSRAG